MTVLGRLSVVISNDPRYVDGETYDVVLDTVMTPDPATVIPAVIPAAPNASSTEGTSPSVSPAPDAAPEVSPVVSTPFDPSA